MYRIQLDPGPWAQYVKRADNIGLPLHEVTKKYMMESNLYATQLFEALQTQQQQSMQSAVAAGASAPSVSSLPSNCIEFVFDTTSGTLAEFTVVSSAPTNYTITWGDGETETGEIGGEIDFEYEYAEEDTQYTVRMCFDDISLITNLDFPGND
jgi:hypothetical protein